MREVTRYYLNEMEAVRFGERLKDAIKAKDKTQYSLSRELGCANNTIYKLSNGAVGGISKDLLKKIARALGVKADYLLLGRGKAK